MGRDSSIGAEDDWFLWHPEKLHYQIRRQNLRNISDLLRHYNSHLQNQLRDRIINKANEVIQALRLLHFQCGSNRTNNWNCNYSRLQHLLFQQVKSNSYGLTQGEIEFCCQRVYRSYKCCVGAGKRGRHSRVVPGQSRQKTRCDYVSWRTAWFTHCHTHLSPLLPPQNGVHPPYSQHPRLHQLRTGLSLKGTRGNRREGCCPFPISFE